ncbi:uncharacterized protein LOC142337205 [Convolutriloba macropyga]|uniref:uncharacterized protein LOC142337205 n=1 Tax=Convolutriloba macropyga TaxID=536237 RepID=UPI003F52524A
MTERKVLNKYYPPDYDYRKIPRLKRDRSAQWVQRVMAPFNMRCNTCGHYIYRGTKFNARRETAQGETYLGLKIFRFYIRCPMCCADISFKTDIENLDYAIETGATRNFEAAKLIAAEDKRKQEEIAQEEANNPMAVLENRTKDSRREMEIMENLEELKERADSNAQTDLNDLIGDSLAKQQQLLAQILLKQEEEDEAFINSLYEKTSDGTRIKRITASSIHDTEDASSDFNIDDCDSLPNLLTGPCASGSSSCSKSTDILSSEDLEGPRPKIPKTESSSGKLNKPKSALSGLVKVKAKPKKTKLEDSSSTNASVEESCPKLVDTNQSGSQSNNCQETFNSSGAECLENSDSRNEIATLSSSSSSGIKPTSSEVAADSRSNDEVELIKEKETGQTDVKILPSSSSVETTGLLSLGNYSDSSNSDDNDGG